METEPVPPSRNVHYYLKRYLQELLEACIGLFVIGLVSQKPFDFKMFARNASILAFATLILEEYNPNFAGNVRQGLAFTVGASASPS